jgi:hypothetical protein
MEAVPGPHEQEGSMARIIVTPDEQSDVVLLDERLYPVHLESPLSSMQVIERLAWAVKDAEAAPTHYEERSPRAGARV